MIPLLAAAVLANPLQASATPQKVWAKLYLKQRAYKSDLPIKTRIYLENASKQDIWFVKRFDLIWIAKDRFGNRLGPHELSNIVGDHASSPTTDDLVRIKAGQRYSLGVHQLNLKGRGVYRVRVVIKGSNYSKELGWPVWSGQAMANEVRIELR
jgi:hypothetical protein